MAQLNKFIKLLHDRNAEVLTLEGGQPISVTSGDETVSLTRDELSGGQLLHLLKEITPPELTRQLRQGNISFGYQAPSGAVDVAVESQEDQIRALVRPSGAIPSSAASNGAVAAQPQSGGNGQTQTGAASGLRSSGAMPAGGAGTELTGDLERLLRELVSSGGSDLHLRVGQPPLFRRDGQLNRADEAPYDHVRIQGMLDAIMPEKDKKEHDETGDADFAIEISGVARFRVNAARDRGGAMAVFRVIPSDIPSCEQLGVTQEVQNLAFLSKGLVVVTGPTGCGKSTTLAALVNLMNEQRHEHILTIEDPIEFVHPSKNCLVTHRQVGLHTKSFRSGLRAALREDPDIVLIGEMRDLETVAIAIETSETGHLVFGTLHTTTAVSTIDRIIDQFPADRQSQIRIMLSESLRGVIAQTLLRKIGGGRVAAREILLMTPAVSNLIREGKTFQLPSIIQTSRKLGMMTLNDSLMDLVVRGVVEAKEAYLKASDKQALATQLKSAGHDVSYVVE